MASGFFMILDDIATLMDDVATLTNVATKKTAGILGDDLAVNAEKSTGFVSSRELPVLWAITKGSFINKLIIVPFVFALNCFFPIGTKIALLIGALFLAYEGSEKILEYLGKRVIKDNDNDGINDDEDTQIDPQIAEKAKIKSAIQTDFILSLEIIIISFSTFLDQPFLKQFLALIAVSLITTIGVYGIVAIIVRLDDIGAYLVRKSNGDFRAQIGKFLIWLLPNIIKLLSILGTIALLLVAGGILAHDYHDFLHAQIYDVAPIIPTKLVEFILAFIVGVVTVLVVHMIKFVKSKLAK